MIDIVSRKGGYGAVDEAAPFCFSMEKLLEKKALLKKLRCYRAYFGQNLFYDAAQDKLLWAVASKFARNRQDCSCWFHFSNEKAGFFMHGFSGSSVLTPDTWLFSGDDGDDHIDNSSIYFSEESFYGYFFSGHPGFTYWELYGDDVSDSRGNFDTIFKYEKCPPEELRNALDWKELSDNAGDQEMFYLLQSEMLAEFLRFTKESDEWSGYRALAEEVLEEIVNCSCQGGWYNERLSKQLMAIGRAETVSGDALDACYFLFPCYTDILSCGGDDATFPLSFAYALDFLEDIILALDAKTQFLSEEVRSRFMPAAGKAVGHV